jgi:hypothetical protein
VGISRSTEDPLSTAREVSVTEVLASMVSSPSCYSWASEEELFPAASPFAPSAAWPLPSFTPGSPTLIKVPSDNPFNILQPVLLMVSAESFRGLSGYRARRQVVDSRGPAPVAGLSLK